MSILRIPLWLVVLAAVAGVGAQARAQFPATTHQFGGAGFWEPDHLGLVQPQIPLNTFEPDFQFFAPADVSTFGGYPEPNIGFFFSYDRLYWNVQRAETVPTSFEGDFTWGNRVDFGYMTETDHGWLASAFHLDGPNELDNTGRFEGVELNKTFRWKPVGKNYIVEPLFGARFMKFIDRPNGLRSVEVLDADGDPFDPPVFTLIREQRGNVENNIVGGQLGVRIHHQTERWVTSIESKFVPAINFQFFEQFITPEIPEDENGDPIEGSLQPTPEQSAADFNEFTIFGQVRFTATYKLTRDISIGTGFDIMHFGRGIGRGLLDAFPFNPAANDPNTNQDVTIGGVSMIFQINR